MMGVRSSMIPAELTGLSSLRWVSPRDVRRSAPFTGREREHAMDEQQLRPLDIDSWHDVVVDPVAVAHP
jgi:hypothetical protein